jgi:hypothetical protein
MEKKEYLSPEMKELEISSAAILAGSEPCTDHAQGGGNQVGCVDPDAE